MFDSTSRYAALPDRVWTAADGREIVYKGRRFLPRGQTGSLLVEVAVKQGDRIDRIAARTLGSGELFWRVADSNRALDPLDLTTRPGRRLRVLTPRP